MMYWDKVRLEEPSEVAASPEPKPERRDPGTISYFCRLES